MSRQQGRCQHTTEAGRRRHLVRYVSPALVMSACYMPVVATYYDPYICLINVLLLFVCFRFGFCFIVYSLV